MEQAHASTPALTDYMFGEPSNSKGNNKDTNTNNNFRHFTATTYSGVNLTDAQRGNTAVVRPNGTQDNWNITYTLDLDRLTSVIDKGDLQFKVIFDGHSIDETWDNDLLEYKLERVTSNWQYIKVTGYGDEQGNDEFNDVEGWVRDIDKGWFNLDPLTRKILVGFYSTDGEKSNNRTQVENVRVYFRDTVRPLLKKVTPLTANGSYKKDSKISFQLEFDEPVKVNTSSTIPMNTGGAAVYESGNYSNTLTYSYIVRENDDQSKLDTTINMLNIASLTLRVQDLGGNELIDTAPGYSNGLTASAIKADGKAPSVNSSGITVSKRDTMLRYGDIIEITVPFTENVNVSGQPSAITLWFNNGSFATAKSIGNNLSSLTFEYIGGETGQDVALLDFASSGSFLGGMITDVAGNPLANQSVSGFSAFNIGVDTKAPTITYTRSGADTYKQTESVRVDLNDGSGTGVTDLFTYHWSAQTYVSDWNAVTTTAAPGTTLTSPTGMTGTQYLHVRAADKNGNVRTEFTPVKLDNTPPVIQVNPNGGTAYQQSYTVSLQASDGHAGMDTGSLKYQWIADGGTVNEGSWRSATLGESIRSDLTGASTAGQWRLAVRASDLAGNTGNIQSEPYTIDRTGPQVTVTPNGSETYSRSYNIQVSASDPAGIGTLQYQWTDSADTPGSGWRSTSSGSTITGESHFEGMWYLHLMATDSAGNVTTTYKPFRYDQQAPTVSFSPDGSSAPAKTANPTVNAVDAYSSVQLYAMWKRQGESVQASDAGWVQVSTANVPLNSGDGSWVLHVKATDSAGNMQLYVSSPYLLDNTAPTGSVVPMKASTTLPQAELKLTGTDTVSETGELEYTISLDGGSQWSSWQLFTAEVPVQLPDQEGTYPIQVKLRDQALNESNVYTTEVAVDRTAPTAEVQYSTTKPTKQSVIATLINVQDGVTSSADVRVVNNNGDMSRTLTENGTFEFIIEDEAGNQRTIEAKVSWIFEEAVSIGVTPDGRATAAQGAKAVVTVTNTAPFEVDPKLEYQWSTSDQPSSSAWSVAADGTYNITDKVRVDVQLANGSYTFELNGGDGDWYLHVRAFDSDGVPVVKSTGRFLLDNTAPTGSVELAQPITRSPEAKLKLTGADDRTINGNLEYAISTDNGTSWSSWTLLAAERTVDLPNQEGTYSIYVKLRDEASNESVSYPVQAIIDQTAPTASIQYSTTEATKRPVTATLVGLADNVSAAERITVLNNNGEKTKELTANGTFTFVLADEAGNERTIEAKVDWIYEENVEVTIMPAGQGTAAQSVKASVVVTNSFPVPVDPKLEVQWTKENAAPASQGWKKAEAGTYSLDGEGAEAKVTITTDEHGHHLELSGVDGSWYLHVRAFNSDNEPTLKSSSRYLLDNTGPTGSVEAAVAVTKSNEVTMKLQAQDNLSTSSELMYTWSTDGGLTWSAWAAYDTEKTVKLPDQEGEHTVLVKFRDAVLVESATYSTRVTIDRTGPSAVVQYSLSTYTKGVVTATLADWSDNVSTPDRMKVTNNGGAEVKTFSSNGAFSFILEDEAGNTTSIEAKVDWIFEELVTISLEPNGSTVAAREANAEVTVHNTAPITVDAKLHYQWSQQATPSDPNWIEAVHGSSKTLAEGVTSRVVVSGGKHQIKLAGAEGSWYLHVKALNSEGAPTVKSSEPYVLDNTAPKGKVRYSPATATGSLVTAYLELEEAATVISPENGALFRVFDQNGEYEFRFKDAAGNIGTVKAEVTWIDPSLSTAHISFSTRELTNKPVQVTISVTGEPERSIASVDIPADMQPVLIDSKAAANGTVTSVVYEVGANGIFHVNISYSGIDRIDRIPVTVDNIDRVVPTGYVTLDKQSWTNGQVIATLHAQDNAGAVTVLNNGGQWTRTFTDNGQFEFEFRDAAGNTAKVIATVSNIDRTAPVGTVSYSTMTWTKEQVTATLSATDNSGAAVVIVNNNGQADRLFTDNGEYTYMLRDAAGNTAEVKAVVSQIDRVAPTGTLSYSVDPSQTTNQAVTVTITLSDASNTARVTNNDGALTYTFEDNGEFVFHIADEAGNTAEVKAVVANMDTIAPQADVQYSVTSWTIGNVTALLKPSEPVRVLNNNGSLEYVFTDNGTFDYEIEDEAGNKATITAKVDYIDRTPPAGTLEYSTTAWTSSNVTVTLQPQDNSGASVTVTGGKLTHTFTDNGEYTFTLKDAAGNIGTVKATVSNIDKTAPTGTVSLSTTNKTNQDVLATLTAQDSQSKATVANNNGSMTYLFTQNGQFTFELVDEAGNKTLVPVTVSNIDKTAPTAQLVYSEKGWTKGNVQVTVKPSEPVTIVNNNGSDTYTFTDNGSFQFELIDQAGNKAVITAEVSNIDRTAPTAEVLHSVQGWTNGDVTATVVPSDNSGAPVIIVSNNGKSDYVFRQNGEFDFVLRDAAGNTATVKVTAANIDKTPPTGKLVYSADVRKKTNQDVTATVTASDTQSKVHIANNDGKPTYTFTANGEFKFELVDEAGNVGYATAVVANIDKEKPTATVEYSKLGPAPTNKDVIVTLKNASERIYVTNNEQKTSYTFTTNGQFAFQIVDDAGNTAVIEAKVDYIDKVAPVGTVTYSTTEPTREAVKATVQASEPFQVSNNLGRTEREFYQNGSYEFILVDAAGNVGSATAVVGNIDHTPPQVTVTYSEQQLTNGPVTATVVSNEPIRVLNNSGSSQLVFRENGTFTFLVADALGNETRVDAVVSNIDKQAPQLVLERTGELSFIESGSYRLDDYWATDGTDGDLTASVVVSYNGFDIAKPGTYSVQYSVTDRAGNTTTVSRKVTVIGKNEKRLFVNGTAVGTEALIMKGAKHTFQLVNGEGAVSIKWKKGKVDHGGMKAGATELAGTEFTAASSGWYTFYVQDQERKSYLVHLYISSL